jgi:hypothetical protein
VLTNFKLSVLLHVDAWLCFIGTFEICLGTVLSLNKHRFIYSIAWVWKGLNLSCFQCLMWFCFLIWIVSPNLSNFSNRIRGKIKLMLVSKLQVKSDLGHMFVFLLHLISSLCAPFFFRKKGCVKIAKPMKYWHSTLLAFSYRKSFWLFKVFMNICQN